MAFLSFDDKELDKNWSRYFNYWSKASFL